MPGGSFCERPREGGVFEQLPVQLKEMCKSLLALRSDSETQPRCLLGLAEQGFLMTLKDRNKSLGN